MRSNRAVFGNLVILVVLSLVLMFIPAGASATNGNKIVFGYQEALVTQTVNVPNNWSSATSLTATVSAAEVQDWKASSDRLIVGIELSGAGGGAIYSHSTGEILLTDGGNFNDYSVTVTASGVGAGWASVASATIFIVGQDGEFWAGNYGTAINSASLMLDGTELLTNTGFSGTSGWTSSLGWQTCSGNSGGLPCNGMSAVEIATTTTTTTTTTTEPPTTTTSTTSTSTTTTTTSTTTTTVPQGPQTIPNTGFETNSLTGWSRGTQTGTLGGSITSSGSGVTVFSGSRTFTHGARGAVGSPTVNGVSNPYYASAVSAGSWTFSPNNASYAVALQPKNEQTFAQAREALGLSSANETAIRALLTADAQAAANGGSPNPTDAAWITTEVELTAGITYTMSWNYIGTDYVPFNDGSITSLVAVNTPSTPTITVNNFGRNYALLGFTNPGTGDYSTNSFGSTGWQISTYEVSVTGTYKLGFAVFNLGDTSLSPLLMIDDTAGTTQRCVPAGSNCTSFGGVAPNNETAPAVVTTTTAPATTTTTSTTTTTTTTLPQPTSLEVTSLLDDGSNGTLRWAITQANAQSGGIYDTITFTQSGTVTLTSDLPAITEGVSITGTGRNTTIIDGNNLYRAFYSAGSRTVTIQNMTLKQGKNVTWNGGTVYNSQGTFNITNVHITESPGWAFYQHGGGVTTFVNCLFSNNNAGITSDHGSTPSAKSTTDSDYTNRIYVNNSQFTNNTYGVFVERFIRISGSTFTGNSVGAYIRGLNRQQVYTSQFTNNATAIIFFSWIPTSWTPGSDNQLVQGSDFDGNGTAINFSNYFNNGAIQFNGISANTWSTSRNNTFGQTTENTLIYQGQGFITDANTVVTTTTTTSTTTTSTTTTTTVPATTTTTQPPAPEPATTTTTVTPQPTPETTVEPPVEQPEEESTPTTEPEADQEQPSDITVPTIPSDSDGSNPPQTDSETDQEETAPQTEDSQSPPTEEETTTSETTLPDEVVAELLEASTEAEIVDAVSDLLAEASEEEIADVVAAVIQTIIADSSVEELTDEDKEKIAAVVTAVIEAGVSEDVAQELASSPAVLASVEPAQAEAVFEQVDAGALTEEVADAIVEAVQDAPSEIREVFEDVVDLFQGAFDDYTMLGSTINVGQRRTVVAVTALTTAVSGAVAAGGLGGSPSDGSSPSSPSNPNDAARKEDEEEEASGEIAGDGVEWIKNIRIFKYVNGVRVVDWKAFTKKFGYGVMNLGFTLAGSLVVYLTLSGPIQVIAGVTTLAAFGASMWLHMKEPEGE